MATATEARHTPEELLKITDRPPPDLVEGQFVEREPMGQEADEIGMRIGALLVAYAQAHLPGVVNGPHAGYQIFPDDPVKVRFPDVSFTRRARLPGGKSAKGHSRVAPDLVVEVVSPNDLAGDLLEKIADYQAVGVPWVLVVHPENRTVLSHRLGGTEPVLRHGDMIRGGDILPGFECPVAGLFD